MYDAKRVIRSDNVYMMHVIHINNVHDDRAKSKNINSAGLSREILKCTKLYYIVLYFCTTVTETMYNILK